MHASARARALETEHGTIDDRGRREREGRGNFKRNEVRKRQGELSNSEPFLHG
jgi:hypothetical protein